MYRAGMSMLLVALGTSLFSLLFLPGVLLMFGRVEVWRSVRSLRWPPRAFTYRFFIWQFVARVAFVFGLIFLVAAGVIALGQAIFG
jgi:hypothetical protein